MQNVGVNPKIMGFPPKWMVKIREIPIKKDDLGGLPPIFGNTHVDKNSTQEFDLLTIWYMSLLIVFAANPPQLFTVSIYAPKKNWPPKLAVMHSRSTFMWVPLPGPTAGWCVFGCDLDLMTGRQKAKVDGSFGVGRHLKWLQQFFKRNKK